MPRLTLDQAFILFNMFLAQNTDKKIRDFVVTDGFPTIDLDITLGSLEVVFGEDYFYADCVVCHYFCVFLLDSFVVLDWFPVSKI